MSNKPIKYTLFYNRKGQQLDKEDEALVQIEAYKDGKRVYFSTGIYLKQEHWDIAKEKVVKRNDSHTLNNRITKTIEEYKEIEHQQSFSNPSFGVSDLKKAIEQKDIASNFISYALAYLEKETQLSPRTRVKIKHSIETFKAYCGDDVKISDFNFKLIDGFRLYLIKKGIGANTQKVYFRHISKYVKVAVKEGLLTYDKNPFNDYKITGEKTSRDCLNEKELQSLEKLEFDKADQRLERIRDLFLLQCYTGLRFSDASVLNRNNIVDTNEGLEIRISKTKKENKKVALPLRYLFSEPGSDLSKPEKLIKKYMREDDKPLFLADNAKQDVSANNQHTNRELKTIQKKAKISTKLTNHVGRHTFATYLIWRVPLPIVQELLQHSKIETTMIYVHVGSEKVKEHLKKITDWV
jgi:site-specific recombinase XerD